MLLGHARSLLFPILLLGPFAAGACEPTPVPAARASTSTSAASAITVLRGMRVIDGHGGAPLEHGVLVLEGSRIRAVGAQGATPIPAGARIIEANGKTVVPGLISDHSHVGLVDGLAVGQGHYTRASILAQLAQYERYGVTTVTSLGMNADLFYELQPELHRGASPGADLFGADRGIGVPSNAPPVDVGASQLYRPRTLEEARAAVRETAARHPSFVKLWVDDFHGTLEAKMKPEVYQTVIEEAHKQHLRVAAHVFYLEDAKGLVASGVDVLAHGVRDRPVDAELIAAMKSHHTWYVPTVGLDETFFVYAEQPAWTKAPFFRKALSPALAAQLDDPAWRAKVLADEKKVATDKSAVAMSLQNVKTLYDAGVSIGFGTDSGATPLRIPGFAEHRELKLLVQAGLTPLQAVDVATANAAALLGLDDRGVLAPGKLADFMVLDGDPSADIEALDHIAAVWHRGVVAASDP